MSDGAKRYKGQLQTYEGSPSGEPIVSTLFDYNQFKAVEYIGEAKYGSQENDNRWHINKYEYDAACSLTSIKTAINKITTKASAITVDTTSNPGFIRLELTDGDLELINPGDRVFLKTLTNKLGGQFVVEKLSATELLIEPEASIVDETNTSITYADLTFSLETKDTKDFDKRRWDKRSYYVYQ
jgi:hypothetical protein